MMKFKLGLITLSGLLIMASASCAQTKEEYRHPANYDLNHPDEFVLWDALNEISGIAFPDKESKQIYAVEDETGTLYRFEPKGKVLAESKFGKTGDYEGIAISKGYVVVLRSDGRLYTFPVAQTEEKEITNVGEWKGLIPKEEYESLAASEDGQLYVICKKCDVDKKSQQTSGYIFQLGDSGEIAKSGEFSIDHQQIENVLPLEGKDFRPSALTKNRATGDWYILSSVNEMLVVTDHQFQVKEVFSLDPRLYNQPEGIAFDGAGNLYISNEGGDVTKKGALLMIKLNPKG